MKFRTVIKHKPGTLIELPHEVIELQPDATGHATFETTDPDSIDRLMDIPEGFGVVDGVPPAAGAIETVAYGDGAVDAGTPPLPHLSSTQQEAATAAQQATTEIQPPPDENAVPNPFVLTDAETGNSLDLAALSDDELRKFVDDNKVAVHHKSLAAGGDKLRTAIVKALEAPAA